MKRNILSVCYLYVFCLFALRPAFAELSVTNKWRIEQAVHHCQSVDNELLYLEYWGDAVKERNKKATCMAEQFARQASEEGDGWLENKAVEFIRTCRADSKKNEKRYYACLQAGLNQIVAELSVPCRQLGAEGLWDQAKCQRLISYIFANKFEKIIAANRPLIEKVMGVRFLRALFNPIAATVFFVLLVMDIVVLTDPGNWMRVPKRGFVAGPLVLLSCYFDGWLRFVCAGLAIIFCMAGMAWNHLKPAPKGKRKKRK